MNMALMGATWSEMVMAARTVRISKVIHLSLFTEFL
jgi:hypothetical protein